MKIIKLLFLTIPLLAISTGCTNIGPKHSSKNESPAEAVAKPVEKPVEKTVEKPAKKTKTAHTGHDSNEDVHWDYSGSKGPENWGDLQEDFAVCSKGMRQSPINITDAQKAKLGRLKIKYKSRPREIINNGHTIQVNMRRGSYVRIGGKRYALLQFHFHSPSEHSIEGKKTDMVVHFVHQAKDGEILVIASLMNSCLDNHTIKRLWKYLPKEAGQKKRIKRSISLSGLLPRNLTYYNYNGSLTTPPCTEGVNWVVLQNYVPISNSQINEFKELFTENARPVQKPNDRVIKVSK